MINMSLKEQYEKAKEKRENTEKEEIFQILSKSEYNKIFYKEFQKFLENIDSNKIITIKDFNNIFIQSQIGENKETSKNIEALQRLLAYKLKKINKTSITNDEKIDRFLDEIVWKENIEIIERYLEWLEESNYNIKNLKSLKDWHDFLVNAWDKLVIPIIAWWMWGMWLFNFLTKWWIESIINQDQILEIPWTQNLIQALITLSILFIIKKWLKRKISKKRDATW